MKRMSVLFVALAVLCTGCDSLTTYLIGPAVAAAVPSIIELVGQIIGQIPAVTQ